MKRGDGLAIGGLVLGYIGLSPVAFLVMVMISGSAASSAASGPAPGQQSGSPLQRVTLWRLAEGGADPVYQPRVALRWLRRSGLLDADHQVTDQGRAELARTLAARRRAARSRRPQEPDPTGGMRDVIRRWRAGDRDW